VLDLNARRHGTGGAILPINSVKAWLLVVDGV
jgi:hypothetical protein